MELNDICASLELSKRLCELGIKQQSLFYWRNIDKRWILDFCEKPWDEFKDRFFSAFTCSELGVLFPTGFSYLKVIDKSSCLYVYKVAGTRFYNQDENEANLRARALIRMIEEKLITAEEVNGSIKS